MFSFSLLFPSVLSLFSLFPFFTQGETSVGLYGGTLSELATEIVAHKLSGRTCDVQVRISDPL